MQVNPEKPRTKYEQLQVGPDIDYDTALTALQAADVGVFKTVKSQTTQSEMIASNYNADGSSKNDPDGRLSVRVANLDQVAQVIAALSGEDPEKMGTSVDAIVIPVVVQLVRDVQKLQERQDRIADALRELGEDVDTIG